MANTKISALTSATTPLAGTEVLPIVQSSTTKQVSVANLTAGRSVSASALTASTGDITSTAGNLVVATSGKGVTTGSSIALGLGVNNGTTNMTIDTTGSVWINQNAAFVGAKFEVTSTGINNCFYRANATGGNTLCLWASDNHGTASTAAYFRVDGGLANYQAYDTNLSDERVKKDISLAGSYLNKICSIPIKTFRFKSEDSTSSLTLGVLAQDVEAIAPELVDSDGWGLENNLPEDGIPMKAIYQTDLQYALMKCIQEQQEIIKQLDDRIKVLESK